MNNFPKTLFGIEVDVMIVACIFKYGADGIEYILYDVYEQCFPKVDEQTKIYIQQQNLLYFRYMELIADSQYFQYLVQNFEFLTSMHFNMPSEESIRQLIKQRRKIEKEATENQLLNKVRSNSMENQIDLQNQLVCDNNNIPLENQKQEIQKHITVLQPIKPKSHTEKHLALLSNYSSSSKTSKNSEIEDETNKPEDSFKLEFLIYNQYMNSKEKPDIEEINNSQVRQKLGQLNYLKQMSLNKLYHKIAEQFRQETQIVREQLQNIQEQTLKSLDAQYELMKTRTINYFESNYKVIEYFIEKTKENKIENQGLSKQLDQLVKIQKTIFNTNTLVNLLTLAKALKADTFTKACCIQLGKNIFDEHIMTNKELLDCTLIQPGDYELIMQSVSDIDMHRLYHLEIESREAYEARQRAIGTNNQLLSSIQLNINTIDNGSQTYDNKQKTATLHVNDLQESRRLLEMYRTFPLKLVPISYVLKEIDYRIVQLKAKYQAMSAIKQACVVQEKMPFYEILLPGDYKSSSSSNILKTNGSERLSKLAQGRTNQFMYRIMDGDGYYTENNGLTVCFTDYKRFISFKAQRSYVLSQNDVYVEIRIDKLGRNSLQIGMQTPDEPIKTMVSNDGIIRQGDEAWDCVDAGFTDGDIMQFVVHSGPTGEMRIYKNGAFTYHPRIFLGRKNSRMVEFTVCGSVYLFGGSGRISINFTDPYFIAKPSWQGLDNNS